MNTPLGTCTILQQCYIAQYEIVKSLFPSSVRSMCVPQPLSALSSAANARECHTRANIGFSNNHQQIPKYCGKLWIPAVLLLSPATTPGQRRVRAESAPPKKSSL